MKVNEADVIIAAKSDGQNYQNKTQAIIKRHLPWSKMTSPSKNVVSLCDFRLLTRPAGECPTPPTDTLSTDVRLFLILASLWQAEGSQGGRLVSPERRASVFVWPDMCCSPSRGRVYLKQSVTWGNTRLLVQQTHSSVWRSWSTWSCSSHYLTHYDSLSKRSRLKPKLLPSSCLIQWSYQFFLKPSEQFQRKTNFKGQSNTLKSPGSTSTLSETKGKKCGDRITFLSLKIQMHTQSGFKIIHNYSCNNLAGFPFCNWKPI